MNPLSGQSAELLLLKVTGSTAREFGERAVASSTEDGIDIDRSLVVQLSDVGMLVDCGFANNEPAWTAVVRAAAEATVPDTDTIPTHNAITSATRARTSPPPSEFQASTKTPHDIGL
jgi:hypothetical protein